MGVLDRRTGQAGRRTSKGIWRVNINADTGINTGINTGVKLFSLIMVKEICIIREKKKIEGNNG